MRVSLLLALAVLAGGTSGCQQYYESRIDKLYERCDAPQLSPQELQDCVDQTQKLAAAYASPRLDRLQERLERNATPSPLPTRVGHNEEDAGGTDYGSNDESDANSDGGGAYRGSNREVEEDDYGEEPFQPNYDSVPPREPEQPTDPD